MLRVFECFAGYGSQSMSLKDLGIEHKVVGISEIDPDAIIGYGAIRYKLDDIEINKDISIDDMRKELISKNIGKDFKTGKSQITRMKKDKLERLYKFNKMSNNFGDISIIDPTLIPDFDYMTYSFPCTDISIAGAQKGIIKNNTRSGLLYECEKIIEIKKPKYLLMENVKALLSKKFLSQFNEWCEYLENLGYTNYYKVLNAKDFGIPQNRERVFMVSVLGDINFEFPKEHQLKKTVFDLLDEVVDKKYYISLDKWSKHSTNNVDKVTNGSIGDYRYDEGFRIRKNGLCPTLTCKTGSTSLSSNPYIFNKRIFDKYIEKTENITNCGIGNNPCSREYSKLKELSPTLCARDYKDPKIVKLKNQGLTIRKLTPTECLRLMGVSDDNIEKMKSIGLSESSLYKLAGNSIVKQCLDSIHKELFKDMM